MKKLLTLPTLIGAMCWIIMFLPAFQIMADKSAARVEQYEGIYIFTDCKPVEAYDYLGSVKYSGGFGDANYTSVRDVLLKRTKKDHPTADAIILHLKAGDTDKADAIKFK